MTSQNVPTRNRKSVPPGVSILHVGGVGTNALINSGLLVERGYQSHVAAYDIYHCVCSPEWQELAGHGLSRKDLGDDYFPNFFRIAESVAARPRWFAQGPQLLTITYLNSLRRGDQIAANILWRTLQYSRFKAVLSRTTVPSTLYLDEASFHSALDELSVATVFVDDLYAAFAAEQLIDRFISLASRLNGNLDRSQFIPPFTTAYIDAIVASDDRLASDVESCRAVGLTSLIGLEQLDWLAISGIDADRAHRAAKRRNGLRLNDASLFDSVMPAWNALFTLYDHRMMYGGSAALGLLSDSPSYMAYEHGTIRSIPFNDDALGRLTRAAYERADAVFLTNTDYATAKRRLEFQADKRTYVPHAFDERPLIEFASAHRSPQRREGPIRLFAPARQDWVLGDPTRSKANHLIVEATAELVAAGETNFEVVFVNWGDDVAATKELIRMRDVEARFSWIDPLARNALWMRYLDSDAILDQFLISGLSGVTYEALTLGCRVITKDDGICNKEFFGVPPPFLAASSSKEIAQRILGLIADPDDLSGIGSASRDWVRQYHSGARFVALQEAQFERVAEITAKTRSNFQSRRSDAVPRNRFAHLLSHLQSVRSSLEARLRGTPSRVRRSSPTNASLDSHQHYDARHDKNDG